MTRLRIGHTSSIWAIFVAATLATAAVAIADEPTVIRGRVLLPDGKPAAGAELYWVRFEAPPPRKPGDFVFEKRAAADGEGRFEFSLKEHDAPLEKIRPRPLIAHLPGYGVDWLDVVQGEVPKEAVLRLVKDNPIRGRVTNTEGRRVADAKVTVQSIAVSPSGSLDGPLAAWKRQPHNGRMNLERRFYAASLLPRFTTVTDQEGRFELSGVGVERLASVNISAPGLVSEALEIVNRPGFDAAEFNKAARASILPQMRTSRFTGLTGPTFDYVAETGLVVRGVVFTGPDRKPVGLAGVGAQGGGLNNPISAQTDESGRFELRGLRRGQDSSVHVYPPRGGNLLFKSMKLDLAPGQTAVDVEVELKEGVLVEGRVFDQVTGRGVKSGVQFVPLPGNEYADQPGYGSNGIRMAPTPTDDDGHFRMLVMPGPGVLMAAVRTDRAPGAPWLDRTEPVAYRQASFSEEDSQRAPVTVNGDDRHFPSAYGRSQTLTNQNAVKVIDGAPGNEPAPCDLPLNPGKTATIAIEDEQGQPVTNAVVSGVSDVGRMAFRIAAPSCAIYGLGSDRPRYVCVLHPERHLAASLTLTGDELGPVTVRLGAVAALVGRALAPDGEPLAEATVQVFYMRRGALSMHGRLNQDQKPLTTDADGRFRVENLLPGERLSLGFRQGGTFYGGPRITDEKRQLKPGELLELGEFKARSF